ncbi:50S ribosomal protein L3 [Capsulimonas corticalis]|uniref:Large ribosomal subunit protein uL3 n=1 Tax=Capsulimonas corticalis TaxID=2219043 RepID=A0A402CYL2_9BACT|nr:50S ribosomal protein L3 [Capsulimonas corticalis]BDI31310.1 50S ribosomal protein L3 [Capsulimonas corticalis]
MPSAILGKKLGMTQIFEEGGRVTPVTVIAAGPCVITQLKTIDRDGYSAAQIGFGEVKEHRLNSPQKGHFAAHGVKPLRVLREISIDEGETLAEGFEFKADIFSVGDKVAVTGISKGKGFAGVVKRYRWHGHNATHGASTSHRKPASSGATDAARTFKGQGKPGHMGDVQVTQQGLRVARIDTDKNLLLVRGAVPGANGGLVLIKKFNR